MFMPTITNYSLSKYTLPSLNFPKLISRLITKLQMVTTPFSGATLAQVRTELDDTTRGLLRRSYYTFTRTTATITATVLTDVLNKVANGGVIHGITMEDLDGAAGADQWRVTSLDGTASVTMNQALGAIAGLQGLAFYLARSIEDSNNYTSTSFTTNGANTIFFDTSFQFQMASHATPTSGVRCSISYGDPPNTFGHKNGLVSEIYEMMLELPNFRIETAYLMPLIRKYVDPEIDCIRVDEQGDKMHVWFERPITETRISDSMKLNLETYLKTTYKNNALWQKDTRKIDPVTNEYMSKIVV